eukprot:3360876-Prymnesium_polylepis.2
MRRTIGVGRLSGGQCAGAACNLAQHAVRERRVGGVAPPHLGAMNQPGALAQQQHKLLQPLGRAKQVDACNHCGELCAKGWGALAVAAKQLCAVGARVATERQVRLRVRILPHKLVEAAGAAPHRAVEEKPRHVKVPRPAHQHGHDRVASRGRGEWPQLPHLVLQSREAAALRRVGVVDVQQHPRPPRRRVEDAGAGRRTLPRQREAQTAQPAQAREGERLCAIAPARIPVRGDRPAPIHLQRLEKLEDGRAARLLQVTEHDDRAVWQLLPERRGTGGRRAAP